MKRSDVHRMRLQLCDKIRVVVMKSAVEHEKAGM